LKIENKYEQMTDDEIRYLRGKRDGLAGLTPSSTSKEYWNGYTEGRRTYFEERLRIWHH
jgi:hypothetical protein